MLATIISSLIRDSISWECKVTEEINGCIVHCPGGAHIWDSLIPACSRSPMAMQCCKVFFILLSEHKNIFLYHIVANIVPVVRIFEIHWYLLAVDHFCNCLQLISIGKYVLLQILRFANTYSLLFKVSQDSLLHMCVFRGRWQLQKASWIRESLFVSDETHIQKKTFKLSCKYPNKHCRCSVKRVGACCSVLSPHTWITQKLPYSLNWESCLSTLELFALVWT